MASTSLTAVGAAARRLIFSARSRSHHRVVVTFPPPPKFFQASATTMVVVAASATALSWVVAFTTVDDDGRCRLCAAPEEEARKSLTTTFAPSAMMHGCDGVPSILTSIGRRRRVVLCEAAGGKRADVQRPKSAAPATTPHANEEHTSKTSSPDPPPPGITTTTYSPPPPSPPPSTPSRLRILLSPLRSLPIPRVLSKYDPVFNYPELCRGLKQRQLDETKLRSLQGEAVLARNSGDPERIRCVFEKISEVAYGKGVTVEEREGFLMKYGCTAYTNEILAYLTDLASHRGFIEIGAGNGQWARAITDHHTTNVTTNNNQLHHSTTPTKKKFEFIIPYDTMSDLPLSPNIYHRHTQPHHEYFHPNVRKCQSPHATDALRKWESRGRVLLLVYPPPGPMALNVIQEYVSFDEKMNDTVVYVGEGVGGANGNNELFDYFTESGEWILVKVMDVGKDVMGGNKGYEKLFVLRRVKKKGGR